MKTYEQIFVETIENEFRKVNTSTVDIKKSAAKEYAKQWVEEAAMLASSTSSQGGDVVNTVLELCKEIDAQ